MKTGTKKNEISGLPAFPHVLEAALGFGLVVGLADVSFELSRFVNVTYDLMEAFRFSTASVFTSAILILPYLVIVFLILRPLAGLRKWPLQLSLATLYFIALLPAGLIFIRNLAVLVAADSILAQEVKTPYYLLKYLWLLIPIGWALASWLAGVRINRPLSVLAGRFSGFIVAVTLFLFVSLHFQNLHLTALTESADDGVAGRENTLILIGTFAVAVILFPIVSWIAGRLARVGRGSRLTTAWIILLIIPFIPPIVAGPSPWISELSGAPLSGRPSNVVLVSFDTARFDDLGCYGNSVVETPAIDSIADEGICFDNAITPMPLTGPSHISMLTGLQPDSITGHGVKANGQPLEDDITTLAEILNSAGYSTAGVISGYPLNREASHLDRGFQFYHDIINDTLYDRMLPYTFWDISVLRMTRRFFRGIQEFRPRIDKTADEVTGQTLDWLDENSDRPFFLFVHYFDPHYSYEPPAPFDTMYMPEYDGQWKEEMWYKSRIDNTDNFTGDDFEYFRSMYRGEISFMDREFGRIVDWGNETGLWDNTLLILTADHGEGFDHDYYFMHTERVYESLIHVPLIIRDPDAVSRGETGLRNNSLTNVSDIFHTILAFLEVTPPNSPDSPVSTEENDGPVIGSSESWDHDLRNLLDNPDEGWNFIAGQSYAYPSPVPGTPGRSFCFRTEGAKLIYCPEGAGVFPQFQFFDLIEDPDELQNIYSDIDLADYNLSGAETILTDWALLQDITDTSNLGPEALNALRALGYIQ